MRRHAKKDPVLPEVRAAVLKRDGYRCVGPELARIAGVEFPGPCRSTFGYDMEGKNGYLVDALQIDHVREELGGARRSEERWLQSLCARCHLDGFATSKVIRSSARQRLADIYGEEPESETAY
jgi:hypothetical protein